MGETDGNGLLSTDYAAALFRERIERMWGTGWLIGGIGWQRKTSGDSHSKQVTVTLLGECASCG